MVMNCAQIFNVIRNWTPHGLIEMIMRDDDGFGLVWPKNL